MLDIKYIRENPDKVQSAAKSKGYDVNISELLKLDEQRKTDQFNLDALRSKRKVYSEAIGKNKSYVENDTGQELTKDELLDKMKSIKPAIQQAETELRKTEKTYHDLLQGIPNVTAPDVPVGGENDGVEIRSWGEKKTGAIDHLDFAKKRDWVDFERGAKVAGAKFFYLKNELALLEMALLQYGLSKVTQHGFKFMDVPYLANKRISAGTGFAPKSDDQSDIYSIEDEDLSLIATAEIPLTGFHADETLDEKDLPLFYAGYSPCFRREAGTYGKHTRGLFRVHQFNKLEMYVFCTPEQSTEIHEKILGIEEEIWRELGIPYRVINIASGDLGAPAYKKYDLEYWSPVDEKYRELTSCSNCTDYQARNLNIRVRRSDGTIETAHTLNGTAVALARTLVALIENFQEENGTVRVPEVLRKYLNKEVL